MNWFKKPINLGITIGAALLVVVALTLVIYGVCTHEEEGLLEVCWVEDTSNSYGNFKATYPDLTALENIEAGPARCENPTELVWPRKQIPLQIDFTVRTYDECGYAGCGPQDVSDTRAVKAAITDINLQLGFEMFGWDDDDDGYEIFVEFKASTAGSPLGWVSHSKYADGRLFAEVGINATVVGERMVYLVAHHELLHVIGLRHDTDNPSSAMYPFTNDDTMEARMHAARITDHDRALVRSLYHAQ